ncbi:hypothetical protein ACMA5K_40305 [Bradyrhizobium diazoefficiens]|uniref:hypothetical protein n=1 Tax=Bradyrhizobium diazoefficiens TaxID=1355477 RepID=UPI001177B583|nr:hypothetical protein [Bradyrhizobium diazoefficiens]QLD46683.1 hypothetical protein HUW42_39855 [Bradyrhizobium diazoefficiens]
MKNVLEWLCLVCFCLVVAAIPLGIVEVLVLDSGATLLGCRGTELAIINCGDGAPHAVEEIILNLPFGFVVAPAFLLHPSIILNGIVAPSIHPWMKYAHPLVIYLYALNLILILAIAHVIKSLVRFATGRLRRRA